MVRAERDSLLDNLYQSRREMGVVLQEQHVSNIVLEEAMAHKFGLQVRREAEFKILQAELADVTSLVCFTPAPHQLHSSSTPAPLQLHSSSTPAPFQLHSSSTWCLSALA